MKNLYNLFFVLLLFISCDNDSTCFQNSGKDVFETIQLPEFNQIDIPKGFSVEIIESEDSKVEVFSYSNYYRNLDFEVLNNELVMTNSISCSVFHSYEVAKVRVYTPTLKKIVSRSQLKVESIGVLTYPELLIITSVDGGASTFFDLEINNNVLKIEDNQIGFFEISGSTDWLDVSLYGGSGRVDAKNLKTYDCTFYQRSNNDILLHVKNKLAGTIYSTGNVILYNFPNQVEVSEKYTGKLIYKKKAVSKKLCK